MTLHFEQAVYGSFPFWNRGYGVLTHSAGCRPQWLAELRHVCQRYGEPPAHTAHSGGLFALPLESGPWLIAGVRPQGSDDLGRPGALAFHALFVGRWSYRWAGGNPFVFAHALRGDWRAEDQHRALSHGQLSWPFKEQRARALHDDAQVTLISMALANGRRVVVQSNAPIDPLARDVWSRLPGRVRMRASVATWAFDTGNDFDLVALPKLTGIALETSDMLLALEPAGH